MEVDEIIDAPAVPVSVNHVVKSTTSSGPVTIVTPANLIVSSLSPVIGTQPKIIQSHAGASDGSRGMQRLQVVRLISPGTSVMQGQPQTVQVATRSTIGGSGDGTIRVVSANPLIPGAKIQIPKSASVAPSQQRTITTQRLILPATSLNSSPQIVTIPVTHGTSRIQTALTSSTGSVIGRPANSTQQVLAILSPHKSGTSAAGLTQPIMARVIAHTTPTATATVRPEGSTSLTSITTSPSDTHVKKEPSSGVDDSKQRKPCNCTKSHCLKLYCDCFANGEFCSNCNCNSCQNNLDHEEQRQKAIKQCLLRNPQAFHPKIGKGESAEVRRHQKGCNCKRSGCLKNYCECFEAKIACGSMCKCVGCKNCEDNSKNKSLMSLADAAMVRTMQQSAASDRLAAPLHSLQTTTDTSKTRENIKNHLKAPVIEAVLDCLLAQCREAETAKCKQDTTEKVVLEEFGRCLNTLIHSSASEHKSS